MINKNIIKKIIDIIAFLACVFFSIASLALWNILNIVKPLFFEDYMSPLLPIISLICSIVFGLLAVIEYYSINIRRIFISEEMLHEAIEAISNYFFDLLENVYLTWLIETAALWFTVYFRHYYQEFVIICYFFPRILVSTIFVYEACILNEKIIFDFTLKFLIVFIVAKIIIFIFKKYSVREMAYYEQFLDIKEDSDNLEITADQDLDFQDSAHMVRFWFAHRAVYKLMSTIDAFNLLFTHYIRLYTYLCFFTGWFYLFLYFYLIS